MTLDLLEEIEELLKEYYGVDDYEFLINTIDKLRDIRSKAYSNTVDVERAKRLFERAKELKNLVKLHCS